MDYAGRVGGDAVGQLDKRAERVPVARGVDTLGGFKALEGDVPRGHVPTYGKEFFARDVETAPEGHNGGLLAVAHREGLVVDAVGLHVGEDAVAPHFLCGGEVDIGFADVVEQRGDDYAVAGQLVGEVGSDVERMLPQPQRGLNIIVSADGTVRKVMIK